MVLLGPTVDRMVVLDWAKFAILFFDEKEICGVGAPQFSNGSSPQVFGYKLVNFLYLELGERE